MRWVFLVVGFGTGLAVGFVLRPRETPRAALQHAPVMQRSEQAPDIAPREEAPPPVPDVAVPVVEPTRDLSEDEVDTGYGRIEVEFDGFEGQRTAWIARTTLAGSREEDWGDCSGDETTVQFDVTAGVHDVWWLRGPHRVGTRVRVVDGRLVRIRAVEFDTPILSRDMAVLGITVDASWGGALPGFEIQVGALDEWVGFRTNEYGNVSAALRPGPVSVRVGDQVTPVVLAAGRETLLEVRHREEGDVLFEPPGSGGKAWLALRTPGKLGFPKRQRYMVRDRDGFLYVHAGLYEVVRKLIRGDGGGTVLGTVQVFAGRASVFRVELPPGVLDVRVEVTDAVLRRDKYVQVTLHSVGATGHLIYIGRIPTYPAPREGKYVRQRRIDGLQPGRFRVTCGSAQETVDVGSGTTRVVLRPLR